MVSTIENILTSIVINGISRITVINDLDRNIEPNEIALRKFVPDMVIACLKS